MTVVYSPDAAPDLQPGVVRWQPRPPAYDRRDAEQKLALLAAATALCLVAVGVVAVGALAIGRLSGGETSVRRLHLERRGAGRGRRLRRPF